MKKLLILLLLLVLADPVPVRAENAVPAVSAASMILIHGDSGLVLAEKNADEPRLVASTTKLMTALTALDTLEPDAQVQIDPQWTRVEGSSMYLRPGEVYSVRDLLYGLLLASGNDAALAIAGAAARGGETFVLRMNEKAAALGLENTHFTNPHGLDHEDHYSTAADMAKIMTAALKNEVLSGILSSRSYSTHGVTYVNHNKLLWRCDGVCGGKTGFTKAAGRCLVTACERDGLKLICVTLSAPDDWRDHTSIYDWAFSRYEGLRFAADSELCRVPVVGGARSDLPVCVDEDISLCVPKGSEVTLCYELPRFVYAPLRRGEEAGRVIVKIGDEPIGKWPVYWGGNAAGKYALGNRLG